MRSSGINTMELANPDIAMKILSVIELQLPEQDTVIEPRSHGVLTYRIKGNATIQHQTGVISLGNGDILFVPPGCSYHIRSGEEKIFCVNISISGHDTKELKHYVPVNGPIIKEEFQAFYNTWCMKKPGYYLKCMSILYSILSHLDKQLSPTYHSPAFHSIQPAVNYMHTHFTEPELSVSTLCRIANLSDTQFRRNFYDVYNTTPLKYLQTLRVNYAADLLSNSVLSIEDISSLSGFADPKYFSTVFKKYKYTSPSRFRKKP